MHVYRDGIRHAELSDISPVTMPTRKYQHARHPRQSTVCSYKHLHASEWRSQNRPIASCQSRHCPWAWNKPALNAEQLFTSIEERQDTSPRRLRQASHFPVVERL
jgi:hypothetical protein